MVENVIPGQRWISNTESELGLGLILNVDANRVHVLYPASGERRVYAWDNAPLTRVRFIKGDEVESNSGVKLRVQSIQDQGGVLSYRGEDREGRTYWLDEIDLNHHLQFNKPQDRLFTGQFDPGNWFLLRYETWRRHQHYQQAAFKGLQGARISLIPHQMYIAHEVANRAAPRVMLADEVGLGKTIEAGLIMHHRLINGLCRRILILVPDSLVHQWLVEMLRRFNLHFSLFDEDRCVESHVENPFLTEQLVICAQGLFAENSQRRQQALAAGWDMVVVDEAHHLEWSELSPSSEYLFVEQLAACFPDLVLLTATPEQLGKESHFARLRLLDPDRFYQLDQFLQEQSQFDQVAEVANLLISGKPLSGADLCKLKDLIQQDDVEGLLNDVNSLNNGVQAREGLIKILLDYHGTGRVLFRNSRHTVKGFPERERFGYLLEGDSDTDNLVTSPYFHWLAEKLRSLGNEKALLICNSIDTVIQLEHLLMTRQGIAAAVFHEGMTIVERDRAAAWFADEESHASVLLCSEIGSEGRNFQFIHHLILFDLPENPDLLQQRIGRLDRIGQRQVVHIHIPFLNNSEQHILFRWYDEGLNAFRHSCSGAVQIAMLVEESLKYALGQKDTRSVEKLLLKTRAIRKKVEADLHSGRDQLLEINSCRPELVAVLIQQLKQREQTGRLWPYLETLFECYGVDVEFHSRDCYLLWPSENMRIEHFPMLKNDGLTVTVNREIALAREDMHFLTDEHPMVMAAMDLVISSETGNAAVSVIKHPQLKPGRFLLEILFVIECSAPPELQVGRYLPPVPIRVLIDQDMDDLSEMISHQQMVESDSRFDKDQIIRFLNSQRDHLLAMIRKAELDAGQQMQKYVHSANQHMHESLAMEINRLNRLRKINPSIKILEIERLEEKKQVSEQNIKAAQLKLDALRFVITH